MVIIYWNLSQDRVEDPTCLGIQERLIYDGLRFPKRRHEWWLGRAALKELLSKLDPAWNSGIQVLSDPDGSPYAVDPSGRRMKGCLTLSHRRGIVAAAWCETANVGIDLEPIEEHPGGFREEYFSAMENEWLEKYSEELQVLGISLVWSMKEAILKALKTGLRIDTRSVEIEPIQFDFQSYEWQEVRTRTKEPVTAFWRRTATDSLITLALIGNFQRAAVELIRV